MQTENAKVANFPSESQLSPVEQWIADEALDAIYSSAYWNDVEGKKKKEWWIVVPEHFTFTLPASRFLGLADQRFR